MGSVHPTSQDVTRVEQATYALLADIGIPFKRIRCIKWINEKQDWGAAWVGKSDDEGEVEIYLGCEPGAIAHEIGHGFLEALNHNKQGAHLPHPFRWPEDGEHVAEAVRFFVEQRMGMGWDKAQWRETINACNRDFAQFRSQVRQLVQAECRDRR